MVLRDRKQVLSKGKYGSGCVDTRTSGQSQVHSEENVYMVPISHRAWMSQQSIKPL